MVKYEIGSKVVYPLHGVGIISNIEEKTVLGKTHSYYIIKLGISDMTVMIPVEKSEELGLRKVVSQKDVENALKLIKGEITDIEEDWKERYQQNFEKMKKGSLLDVAEVVRNLYHRNKIKELSIMEKKLYENAFRLLVDEIAYVLDIDKEKARDLIAEGLESSIKE